MDPKIRTEGLTRTVGPETIVDGVSVSVQPAETVAVLGPSGSGKSSFLRLLNRLDEPTGGTVYLDGRDYRTIDPQALRRRVGLVRQSATMVGDTVFETVAWGYRLREERPDAGRIRDLLRSIGLDGMGDCDVEDLSGGEAQRVSLARTLLNDPEVLLLDEPTANLDRDAERSVESVLADLGSLTTVLVTHDREQARRMADRAMRMRDGRAVEVGSVEGVVA